MAYWIKLYVEILDDPKMGRLPDYLWRRAVEVFLLAGQTFDDGRLPSLEDMAWKLRVQPDTLLAELQQLARLGIVTIEGEDYTVTNFKKRQDPATHAERQKRYRESRMQAAMASDTPSGPCDIPSDAEVTQVVTNSHVDTDTDTDIYCAVPARNIEESEGIGGLPELNVEEYKARIAAAMANNDKRRQDGQSDLSWLPEHLRPLAQAHVDATGQEPKKPVYSAWRKALQEQAELGLTPDHIQRAVGKLRTEGMTIKGPFSVTGTATDMKSKDKKPQPSLYTIPQESLY